MPDNISVEEQGNRRAKQINSNSREKAFKEYLMKFEGFDEVARKGTGETNYTIGHGHASPSVKKGQRITRKEASLLLDKDIKERIPEVQNLIPKFDSFPSSAQTAIFGEYYRGSVGGSPDTVKAINAGEYEKAAKEFLDNDEYRERVALNRAGIGPRMERVSSELMKMSK
jgi:GH24 family phage-related lysozyme (muramidase)